MAYGVPDFIFGGTTGLSYQELKRRQAIATALAARQRKYPQNFGEGLTYLAESVREGLEQRRLREAEKEQEGKEQDLMRSAPPSQYTPGATPAPPAAVTLPPPPPPPDPSLTQPRARPLPPRPGDVPVQNAPQNPALLQQLPGAHQGALQGGGQPDYDNLFNPDRAQNQPLMQPAAPLAPMPAAGPLGPRSGLGGPAGPAGAVSGSREAITAALAQRSLGAPMGAGMGVDGGGGGGGPIYPPTASLGGAGSVSDASPPGAGPVPPPGALAQNRTRTVPLTSSDAPLGNIPGGVPVGGQTLPPVVPRRAPLPSDEAIPPATDPQYPPPRPEPRAPGLLGPDAAMQFWEGVANNPNVSPERRAVAAQQLKRIDDARQELQRRQQEEYRNQREGREQDIRGQREWDLKKDQRRLEQQAKRLEIQAAIAKANNQPVEAAQAEATLAKTNAELARMQREAAAPETISAAGTHFERPAGSPPNTPFTVRPGLPKPKVADLTEAQARTLKFFEGSHLAKEQGGDFSAMAGWRDTTYGKLPIVGNYATSPEFQRQNNAADAWIENTLRDVSGATIRPEEYPDQKKIYFPQPGDKPEQIKDKEERRQNKERALLDSLGDARPIAEKYLEDYKTKKEEDRKAVEWAKQNPDDPRAQAIKRRLGVQ